MQDDDFEKERTWLLLNDTQVMQQDQGPGETGFHVMDLNVPLEEEGGIECECCFSHSPFVRRWY